MKPFKEFLALIEAAIDRGDHLEVTTDYHKEGRIPGTAIEHRGNQDAYGHAGIGGADHVVNHIMKKADTNLAHKTADEYSHDNLGHGYENHTIHPESSLKKQYVIGQAYKHAVDGKPEYKKAVFDDYTKNRPDIIKHTKATDYDSLVAGSYHHLAKETNKQFERLPVKMQYHDGHLGYHNSGEAMRDVHLHNNLTVYRGGDQHEFLHNVDKKNGLNENEKFRAVHDYFGHAVHGNQFGPKGEEVAHSAHQKLFTPASHVALASETRGQNSLVNYSHHNLELQKSMEDSRGLKRAALNRGDHSDANAHSEQLRHLGGQWKYADQKAVALPSAMLNPHFDGSVPEHIKSILHDPEAKNNSEYDVDKDKHSLVQLAKHHNTSSHNTKHGGILDHDKAHDDLKHIASVHGYHSLSRNPFVKE
jgi:hypothetical protein